MISVNLKSPHEMMLDIAGKVRARRLAFNLSQQSLSDKSGVSYGVLKKFERTGQISLESLLKLAIILDAMDAFGSLFAPDDPAKALSLDDLMRVHTRQRGRK